MPGEQSYPKLELEVDIKKIGSNVFFKVCYNIICIYWLVTTNKVISEFIS